MSKARAKGTAGENFFLEHLRALFGEQVERAPLKGIDDYGDYVNVPWLHEAKNTKKPLFQKWARICEEKVLRREKAEGRAGLGRSLGWDWVILWKGDLRKQEGPYVLMPLKKYEQLVNEGAWYRPATEVPGQTTWTECEDENGYCVTEIGS